MEAAGSILTNKYAEGYPYRYKKDSYELDYSQYGRYYGGCHIVDEIEKLAIERAKDLFKAEHANVQAHSGSSANMASFFAVLKPNDTILSLELGHGGHLTHGSPVSFSGNLYNIVHYGVEKDTQVLNYDNIRSLAKKVKPALILTGASAYPRKLDFAKFREIAYEVGAIFMVDMAHIAGLVATGLHENPVKFADIVTSTTHKTLRGPRSGFILCKKELSQAIDKQVFPGIQGGPLMHIIAAKATAFKLAKEDSFKEYQKQVVKNAISLADALKKNGFNLVSGGTDTHLILIDLGTKEEKKPSGKKMETLLDKVGITVNKNVIPFDTRSPFITSGIRLGTPAVTTRGFKENEMQKIADLIKKVYDNYDNEELLPILKEETKELTKKFPLYTN